MSECYIGIYTSSEVYGGKALHHHIAVFVMYITIKSRKESDERQTQITSDVVLPRLRHVSYIKDMLTVFVSLFSLA